MGKNTPAPAKPADDAKAPVSKDVAGAGATPATDASADTAQGTSAPDATAKTATAPEAKSDKKGFVTLDCNFGQICIDGENYQSQNGKVTVPKEHAEKAKKICG